MRIAKSVWVGGAVVLVVAGAVVLVGSVRRARDEADLREQLRLARQEGLATTGEEFKAFVPTASTSENAAPLYRKLHGLTGGSTDPGTAADELVYHPSAKNVATAQAVVDGHRAALKIVDQAVLLPKCWFDRDWSKGAAVLMPEYGDMRSSIRLLALRGSLAANRGDVAAALADARKMLRVGDHAGQEGTGIARLIREGSYGVTIRTLEGWAFMHPAQPAYRDALKKTIDDMPRPSVKDEQRDFLSLVLSIVDLCATPAGRRELGLSEDQVGLPEKVLPLLSSHTRARTGIVRAERKRWAALGRPERERPALLADSEKDLGRAMSSFPTAAAVYGKLSDPDKPLFFRESDWEARRQAHLAVLRALQGVTIPSTIDTSDLRSPFDGKRLSYKYDARQIVIGVSGYEGDSKPLLFKIPPDKVSKN